jgi:hypothetical protein
LVVSAPSAVLKPLRCQRAATADGGTERRSETSGKESATNNMGIGLIVQRSDRHVDILAGILIVIVVSVVKAEATVERGSPNIAAPSSGLIP